MHPYPGLRTLILTAIAFSLPCLCDAQPSIAANGVFSAQAFGGFTSIAPGSWIEIYGSNLATTTTGWTTSDFNGVNAPTMLGGTQVTIGGQDAFIDYVSPGQVNAQVPSNVATGLQNLTINTAAGTSAAYPLLINSVEPGLLAPSSFVVDGNQNVAALFSDGATYVLPPGTISGVTSKRAQPGDVITLYGVGFGQVTPNIPAGQIVQESNTLALPLQILFGSTPAQTSYSGLAPNAVGLYQFNVTVPNVPASDMTPLTFDLGGEPGTQVLYIAVGASSGGGGLPLFGGILANVTFSGNGETSITGHIQIIRNAGDSSYSYSTVYAQYLPISTPVSAINALFNSVMVTGDTFVLGDLSVGGTSAVTAQTSTYGITAASVNFTLAPTGAPGVGNVTGSYTFTSSQGTLTGTIAGTYTAQ
jgi:uncharacterized protein (TIGR03437 family)